MKQSNWSNGFATVIFFACKSTPAVKYPTKCLTTQSHGRYIFARIRQPQPQEREHLSRHVRSEDWDTIFLCLIIHTTTTWGLIYIEIQPRGRRVACLNHGRRPLPSSFEFFRQRNLLGLIDILPVANSNENFFIGYRRNSVVWRRG